jgi:hypothetical protein
MKQTKLVLKDYFETGDKPTQQQYENLIDSLRHAYDKIPLEDLEEDVVSQSEFQSHLDNATFNGDVTAVNFIGDGSQLTGISLDNLPDSQVIIKDTDQSNVNIGDTQSSILFKGMYASGSTDDIYSQVRLRLVKDQADGTAGSAFAIDVMNNAGGASVLTERFIIDSDGNFDFKSGTANFGGGLDITKDDNSLTGITITNLDAGSGAAATLKLTSDGGSGYMYKTSNSFGLGLADRLGIQNQEGILFVTGSTLLRYEIDSSGNHDFQSGTATFGGLLTANNGIVADGISTFSNVASNWIKINGGVDGTNDAAISARGNTLRIQNDNSTFGTGDISIEADGETYITSDVNTSVLKANNGSDFRIKNQTGSSIAIFKNDLSTTFASNIIAPNLLGNVIGSTITSDTPGSSVQIRNNSGQPVASFSDALNTAFYGSISIPSDQHIYLGDTNNTRLFNNNGNSFFDGLTGDMYFRNQFDGGKMYFQVEDGSGADLNLIEIHGDTQDVYLRHGNSLQLQTTSEGIRVNGELSVVKSGTATPHADTDLFVADSTAAISAGQMQILGGNTGSSNLYFSDTDNYSIGGIKYLHSTDEMIFKAGGVDLLSILDKGVTIGSDSTTGQPRLNYKKDANNSSGYYVGYLNSSASNNDFGIYSYESGDFKLFTNNSLGLTIDTSQNSSFSGEITATGAITSNAGFSTGPQAANTGSIRLENDGRIISRNSTNNGNRTLLYLDTSNVMQLAEAVDTNMGGNLSISGGTLELNSDGLTDYTHSRVILNSDGNARGAGMFSYGANYDWFWGNPYLNHDSDFIIAKASSGTGQATAQTANAIFTATDSGIKVPTSIEISRAGWNTYSIQQSAGNGLQFYDATAGNSTMYLINDKVGINNTNPSTELDITGEAKATNFIGNWNGKTTTDVVSATGDVAEDITGTKVFTDGLTMGYYSPTDAKAYLSAKDTNSSVTTNLLEYGAPGLIRILEPTKFTEGLESTDYKLTGLNIAPSSATDTGAAGEIRYTVDHIYVCTAINTWKRVALATW